MPCVVEGAAHLAFQVIRNKPNTRNGQELGLFAVPQLWGHADMDMEKQKHSKWM